MEQNKNELLLGQIDKINILSVVRDNLKDWAEKGGINA